MAKGLLAPDDLVGMVQQVFEQRKFFWGEIDGPPLSLDGVRDRIDHQVTHLQSPVGIGGLAA